MCACSRTNRSLHLASFADLEKKSLFAFSVFSDTRGDSPYSRREFARFSEWTKHDVCLIGLGDLLKKGRRNDFLEYLAADSSFTHKFYPVLADGENEFYGKGQGDWGAGKPLFTLVDLENRKNVELRANKSEYYAQVKCKGYTVHIIALHFPDTPKDANVAFPKDSRKFLYDTLKSIHKGKREIIVVLAHSRMGFWLHELDYKQKELVMKKCDLVFSATTHVFDRLILEEYGNSGALVLNTGSLTAPRGFTPCGFIRVNVLEKPPCLVVQYLDASQTEPTLQTKEYAYRLNDEQERIKIGIK